MNTGIIQKEIDKIKIIPSYWKEKEIQKSILLINQNLDIKEIGEINEINKKYAYYYVIVLNFFCISHQTSGGNQYIKENYHLIVQDPNSEQDVISYNGWKIKDLETYGEDFGYPNKMNIKFRFMDIFGCLSEEIKMEGEFLGTYYSILVKEIAHMLELLKQYSEYHSLENYKLINQIEELESELRILKATNTKVAAGKKKKTSNKKS